MIWYQPMTYNWFPSTHRPLAGQRNVPRRHFGTARYRSSRRAMTLLEVILSIAILCGALAVLGELVRVGTRACRKAEMLSTAQLLADSLAAELSAQRTATPESTEGVIEHFGGASWTYTVDVQPGHQPELLVIAVTVSEDLAPESQPVSYSLVQWMIDPQVEIDLETASAEAEAAAAPTPATAGDSSAAASGPAGGLP